MPVSVPPGFSEMTDPGPPPRELCPFPFTKHMLSEQGSISQEGAFDAEDIVR